MDTVRLPFKKFSPFYCLPVIYKNASFSTLGKLDYVKSLCLLQSEVSSEFVSKIECPFMLLTIVDCKRSLLYFTCYLCEFYVFVQINFICFFQIDKSFLCIFHANYL